MQGKGKGKLVCMHAVKTYGGRGGVVARIWALDGGDSLTIRPLYPLVEMLRRRRKSVLPLLANQHPFLHLSVLLRSHNTD